MYVGVGVGVCGVGGCGWVGRSVDVHLRVCTYVHYSWNHGVCLSTQGEEDSGSESAEEGEDDGFFVPHGYLSEDEGERSESEEGPAGLEVR